MLRLVHKHFLLTCVLLLAIQACSTAPSGRYSIKHDSAPKFDYGDISYIEPTPIYEPYNVWTSRPYEVLGGFYTPMLDSKGYEEEGYASWYGQKFHGHTTANGETFDMFALTAAHKTLPLPSFVKVTNLENNKSATVRVNDRGPFHDDRILDLSYGAAKKLGFHSKGVTKVKVEIIHVSESGIVSIGRDQRPSSIIAQQTEQPRSDTGGASSQISTSVATSNLENAANTVDIRRVQVASPMVDSESLQDALLFVQVTASSDEAKVKDLATGLSNLLQVPNSIPKQNNLYRLHLGPMENEQKAQKLIQDLHKIGFENAFRVEFSPH